MPKISDESLKTAQSQIEYAKSKEAEIGKSAKSLLKGFYEQMFDSMGGARDIAVDGVSFESKPYVVALNKSSIKKIISDFNLSAEKLSVFNNIDEIIKNANYVESSTYVPHSKKLKDTIRFDYFKSPVKIAGYDYVESFDVEIFPSTNNYRTHKVINEMDLTLVNPNALAGPNPTAQGRVSNPLETNLSQSNNSVNTHAMQKTEIISKTAKFQMWKCLK